MLLLKVAFLLILVLRANGQNSTEVEEPTEAPDVEPTTTEEAPITTTEESKSTEESKTTEKPTVEDKETKSTEESTDGEDRMLPGTNGPYLPPIEPGAFGMQRRIERIEDLLERMYGLMRYGCGVYSQVTKTTGPSDGVSTPSPIGPAPYPAPRYPYPGRRPPHRPSYPSATLPLPEPQPYHHGRPSPSYGQHGQSYGQYRPPRYNGRPGYRPSAYKGRRPYHGFDDPLIDPMSDLQHQSGEMNSGIVTGPFSRRKRSSSDENDVYYYYGELPIPLAEPPVVGVVDNLTKK